MPEITVWTKQNKAVLGQLSEAGRFVADERFIRRELQDTSDVMLFIYRWLADHAPISGERPDDAVYPVWVSFVEEATMIPEPGYVVLELKIDTDNIAAVDIMKWTGITNYSYLPADEEDEKAHIRLLSEYGTDNAQAVMSQFYPDIRSRIISSWSRLFEPVPEPGTPGTYGIVWEVRNEWVQRVIT